VRAQLEARLDELRREYTEGQRMLDELAQRTASLQEKMLRISGAIQVLEEELADESGSMPSPPRTEAAAD
jgi:uncharacterized coiled-coil protein SlyX